MSTAEKFGKFLFFFLSSFFCLYSRAAKNTTIVLCRLILIHLFRYIVNIVAVWYYCKLSYIQALIIYCCFCLWNYKAQRCLYFFSKSLAYSYFLFQEPRYFAEQVGFLFPLNVFLKCWFLTVEPSACFSRSIEGRVQRAIPTNLLHHPSYTSFV